MENQTYSIWCSLTKTIIDEASQILEPRCCLEQRPQSSQDCEIIAATSYRRPISREAVRIRSKELRRTLVV
ncbi:MAG: hypothetical protein IPQ04_02705 [Saprospiraceae bacterium]|nr:hypothetical protein [Saprospiraceae bacterium]